ncbi:hypothetical protein JCM21714_4094 [Gracilibacillus boraciitolerans JCM 21714]|uniref:Uncharacterized protein n=1 Tax=Gracilibacillus boraciitolerans JCM 21714 TaxID=1298598 RepID=W4VNA9_9BACI|nr:hypothetical protein [Gracilibacillus boraciitolerans]GAE94895.1 hypothetical protein JCM21714_4094 [Gracilibacillus boraciitolerans JCM 21714]
MQLSNFILHNDILLIHADINGNDYVFTVKWKTLQNKKGGEWELKSYLNNSNGKKDLTEQQLTAFINRINPTWDWEKDQQQILNAIKND